MKEIKMKDVSNLSAALGLAVVLATHILNCANVIKIDIWDAIAAGGFCKAIFLPVDASVIMSNIHNWRRDNVCGN